MAETREFRVPDGRGGIETIEGWLLRAKGSQGPFPLLATSDGGYYADPYLMGGARRLDRELARALSPLAHVEKATTPTLFMQGAEDQRCPRCRQSEELFVSLLRAGSTPAELVLYPGADHHFLGDGAPSVRADAVGRIIEWLDRHVPA